MYVLKRACIEPKRRQQIVKKLVRTWFRETQLIFCSGQVLLRESGTAVL